MATTELPKAVEGKGFPSWREQGFSEWTHYKPEDIQRVGDMDLPEFDRQLAEAMRSSGYEKARTLEELRAKMLADRGGKRHKKSATPADYRTYATEQLKAFHQFETQRQAAEMAERERAILGAESQLENRANQREQQALATWNKQRQPRDQNGAPRELRPADSEWLANREEQMAATGKSAKRTERLEMGFFRWLDQAEVLGSQARIEVAPTTRIDDVRLGVDGVTRITIPDEKLGSRTIPLGIDFTVNNNEIDLAYKLSRVQSDPIGELSYGTSEFPPHQKFLRTVVSVDDERMSRMTKHLFVTEVAQGYPEGASVKAKGDALAAKYHDQDVFMASVADEIREQVAWGREVMLQQNARADVGDHDALITYLDTLRQERIDLHTRARMEVEQEGVGAYYRTQDAQFIRHAPEVMAGAAESKGTFAVA